MNLKLIDPITWLRKHPAVLFGLVHAILFLVISASMDNIVGNNLLENDFASLMLSGHVPYANFSSEYPPLALISFLPAASISNQPVWYGFLFAVQLLLYDVVILYILDKLARHLQMNTWFVMGAYTLCLLSLGVIVTGRFDLLPAMLSLVAIYAFIRGKNKTAWAFLALGASAKIYPLAIAPLFALYLLRQGQIRRLISGIAVFGILLLAVNLPFYIISPKGFMDFLSYHTQRGLHAESVYGSVLLIGKITSLIKVNASLTFGSWNLISPLADTLAKLSFYVTGFSLAVAYWLYSRILWKKTSSVRVNPVLDAEDTYLILRFALLVVMLMLITSKVLSPQFLIWLYPLIPLVFALRLKKIWWLLPAAGVLSQYIYPYHYLEFEAAVPYLVIMLLVRNLILTGFTVMLFFRLGANTRLQDGKEALGVK